MGAAGDACTHEDVIMRFKSSVVGSPEYGCSLRNDPFIDEYVSRHTYLHVSSLARIFRMCDTTPLATFSLEERE